jgi:hypothetical protein
MRRRAIVAGALVVAGVLVYLAFLRDPFDGNTQVLHRAKPVFNVLYNDDVIRKVKPRAGELLRLRARRGALLTTTTVRRLRLPAYQGLVSGALPVFADAHARALAQRYDGFALTVDTRARVHTSPGYELGFTFTTPTGIGEGTDLLVVPKDTSRDGVILSYRLTKPSGRQPRRLRKAAKAMRSALRSFEFGPDRF